MKKNLFILAVAGLALASCSSDETIATSQASNEISFRPLMTGVTRASSVADVTTGNLSTFTVNAMLANSETSYFTDNFTGSSGNPYVSTIPHYWPATESLDFYAYAPAGNSQVTYTNYKTFTVIPTAGTDPASQVDLVYAATKGKNRSSSSAGVALNFRHTGAKIVCKVINSSATLKFGVEGWKVGYLSPQGTFVFADTNTDGNNTGSGTTLSFSQWPPGGTKAYSVEYASTFTKKTIAVSTTSTAEKLDGEFILIPQRITAATAYANGGSAAVGDKINNTFIAVKLYALDNVNNTLIAGGGTTGSPTTIWAIWPIGDDGGTTPFNWEPGKQYTYTIDLAGCGYYETNQDSNADLDPLLEDAIIKFVNVSVDNWTEVAKSVPQS